MGRETHELRLGELVLSGTSFLGATTDPWRPAHLATRGWGLDYGGRPREHAQEGTSAHGARAHCFLRGASF